MSYKNLILIFFIGLLFSSCSIQKRRYSKGYYVEYNSTPSYKTKNIKTPSLKEGRSTFCTESKKTVVPGEEVLIDNEVKLIEEDVIIENVELKDEKIEIYEEEIIIKNPEINLDYSKENNNSRNDFEDVRMIWQILLILLCLLILLNFVWILVYTDILFLIYPGYGILGSIVFSILALFDLVFILGSIYAIYLIVINWF